MRDRWTILSRGDARPLTCAMAGSKRMAWAGRSRPALYAGAIAATGLEVAATIPADPQVNEFEAAGLTLATSVAVRAPRVAESPIHFECRGVQIIDLGNGPGAGSVVLGRIVYLHVDDDLLAEAGNLIRLLCPYS